jgi:peroxiredoxin
MSIKNSIILLLVSIVCASCLNTGNKGTISGTLKGAEGKTIYLERTTNNKQVLTDSSVIGADGSFAIVPAQPLDFDFYLMRVGDGNNGNDFILITDSSECPTITGEISHLKESIRIEGSVHTQDYYDILQQSAVFDQKEQAAREKLTPGMSPAELDMINQEVIEARKERSEVIKKWLDTHSGSPAALLILTRLDPRTDMALFNKVFQDSEASCGRTPIYKSMKKQVQMLMTREKPQPYDSPSSNISTGKMAPDIALPDPNGKIRKLSDLRGKTVLVDFWASWCKPCRMENPNVVQAYHKYNKDGFEVFSVSLDQLKDSWKKAIDQDKLVWPNHVSDLKHWDSEAAKLYNVHSIPFTVLVDKEGKILGHNLRGAMLEDKLKAIYGH